MNFGDSLYSKYCVRVLITSCSFAILAVLSLRSVAIAQCEPVIRSKLLAPDSQPDDDFGYVVAISGDVGVIGAPGAAVDVGRQTGSAYAFELQGEDAWTEMQKLTVADCVAFDHFGSSLGISDHTIIIGAPGHTPINGYRDAGSAYIMRRDIEGEWVRIQELTANDGAASDAFGVAVAIEGNVAVVGAPRHNGGAPESGAAYVFKVNDLGNWVQVAELTASDGEESDWFGTSVAMSGNSVTVGAPHHSGNAQYAGSAYVFQSDNQEHWSQIAVLNASDRGANDQFGQSVAINAGQVLVGASKHKTDGVTTGAAYVFKDNGQGEWSQTAQLLPYVRTVDTQLGVSVAFAGSHIVVGGFRAANDPGLAGAAYVFTSDYEGRWKQTSEIDAPDAIPFEKMGCSVAASDQVMIIGASTDGHNGHHAGSAYAFDLNCDGVKMFSKGPCPGQEEFTVTGATSGGQVAFIYAISQGILQIPTGNPCAGTTLGLNATAALAGQRLATAHGVAQFAATIPPAACGHVYLQALDISTCTTTNVVLVQ